MSTSSPPDRPRGLGRRLLPLAAIILIAAAGYFAIRGGTISLESLVRYRSLIDGFFADHRLLSVLAYIGLFFVSVSLSFPSAAFLSVVCGLFFCISVGGSAPRILTALCCPP